MRLAILSFSLVLATTCHCQDDFIFPDQIDCVLKNRQQQQALPTTAAPAIVEKVNPNDNSQEQIGTSSDAPQPPISTSFPRESVHIQPEKWEQRVVNIISQGITKFTLDMDHAITNTTLGKTENLLFSPVSLSLTLAIVMLAASGKTFDEVSKILGVATDIDISHHSEVVHQILGLLMDDFEKRQKLDESAPKTNIAFGIFVEDGFPVREEFRKVSQEVYSSEVTSVDFSTNSKGAKDIINNWVAEKTLGKIMNLLQQPPNPTTKVLIASALYFSGEWEQHFIEGATRKKKFAVSETETVYVDMMAIAGYFPFHEDKERGLKIIGFPYKANEITMYAVLPTRGKGTAALDEIKSQLTPKLIEELISNTKNRSCIVGFPRMKLSSNLKLRSALKAMGLNSLFDPAMADMSILSPGRNAATSTKEPDTAAPVTTRPPPPKLSNKFPPTTPGRPDYIDRKKRQSRPIDEKFVEFLESQNLTNYGVDELRNTPNLGNPGLYADEVLHKVEMTVNERGTEAAAATSTFIDRSNEAKRFIANRPFLFFIRHDVGKFIWFWGTINRPAPAYDSM